MVYLKLFDRTPILRNDFLTESHNLKLFVFDQSNVKDRYSKLEHQNITNCRVGNALSDEIGCSQIGLVVLE